MRLLQRKAEDLGISISIISADEMTRQLCAATGLPNYPNAEDFKRDAVHRGYGARLGVRAARARRPLASWFSAGAGLVLFGLIALAGYFVLPAASIVVTPAAKTFQLDAPVTIDEQIGSPDAAGGRVPGHVKTAEVDGQASVRATGKRDEPDQKARGLVTFTNRTGSPLTLPAGTTVLSGKVAFTTSQDVPLGPSIKIAEIDIPGTAVASVQAVDPGEQGNVPVGGITGVDGPLATKVSVINHTALSGGSKKKVSYLSSDDQAKAKEALRAKLVDQALAQIRADVPADQTFIPDAGSQSDAAIEQLSYAESPEQVTAETRVNMRVLVRGLTFRGQDVNQAVAQAVDGAVAQQGSGAHLAPGTPLSLAPPQIMSVAGGVIKLQVHASATVVSPPPTGSLPGRVRGMDPAQAEAVIRKLPGVASADVQLWPAWAKRVPSLGWRVHVTTNQATG